MAEEYKLQPSNNRGPGVLTRQQTGTLRNELSQVQTVSKKRKIEVQASENAAIGLADVGKEVGGKGLVVGAFVDRRQHFSPKGRPIPPITDNKIRTIYRGALPAGKATALRAFPKYNVGPGYEVGMNTCPKTQSSKKSAAMGFQSSFRAPVTINRAQRLADYGVNMITMVEAELSQQNNQDWLGRQAAAAAAAGGGAAGAAAANLVAPPVPPTKDEVLAAMQLSILLGWENRNLAEGARRGVNKEGGLEGL